MAKDKVTLTLDPAVAAATDADASEDGMNRSEYVERVLRDAHYRRLLARTGPAPLPGGDEAGLRALLAWQADPGKAA